MIEKRTATEVAMHCETTYYRQNHFILILDLLEIPSPNKELLGINGWWFEN
jgi:hypothetical protein